VSIPGRLIRLMAIGNEIKVMTSANYMAILKGWSGYAAAVIVRLKALAPYALIELILPGGSVMALLLWLYRRRKHRVGCGQASPRLWLSDPLPFSAAGWRGVAGGTAWNSRVFCQVRAGRPTGSGG
jgi:hypothetical protein